uniref:NADH-ubiquinone oxidoreductase chain 3 n=1 Tax=Eteoneus sigillatus TaxID=1964414 RepID=A0A343BT71_9HEMI|nr:NADH dehydrogenase subunit 3 [Eteoneus sigillatus]
MFKMIIMIMLTSVISMLMMLLYNIINKKMNMERNKMSPFECGFDPKSSARISFSTQFFLVGILFLIFDVELIMVMPMVLTSKTSQIKLWIITSTTLIIILIIGLYYEWKNGAIEWMNPV